MVRAGIWAGSALPRIQMAIRTLVQFVVVLALKKKCFTKCFYKSCFTEGENY